MGGVGVETFTGNYGGPLPRHRAAAATAISKDYGGMAVGIAGMNFGDFGDCGGHAGLTALYWLPICSTFPASISASRFRRNVESGRPVSLDHSP